MHQALVLQAREVPPLLLHRQETKRDTSCVPRPHLRVT